MSARVLRAAALAMVSAAAACGDREASRDAGDGGDREIAFDSIASPAAPGSTEPNLAAGPDGRVWLSWIEPAGTGAHALRVAVREGDGWSRPRTVTERSDFFLNWADFPSLAVLDDGRLAAHWLQRAGAGKYAYEVRIAQSRDGGATWSEGVVPHGDATETEHGFVSLWEDDGSLGAVWLDGRKYARAEGAPGRETMLLHAVLDSAGTPGAESTLDERICDCCQTDVARTSSGPVVAYRDRSAEEIRDIHVVRRVDGRWLPPAPVHRDGWRIDYCPVNGPAIAAAGTRVVVAWFTAPGDSAQVRVATSADAGATFAAPVRIDEGAPAGRVGLALLPDGDALVTWIERAADGDAVRARRVARDGALRPAFTLGASSAERASGFPRVVAGSDEVVAAWTVPGDTSVVRVARARLADGGHP